MSRKKIYMMFRNARPLSWSEGSGINEICLMINLSKFADVYYNDQYFDPKKKGYGIVNKPLTMPSRKYDLYYVRSNKHLFLKLPRPKVWMVAPYDEECYKEADAVCMLNDVSVSQLKNINKVWVPGIYDTLKGQKIVIPKNILSFKQSVTSDIQYSKGHSKTIEYRKKFGGDFVIGMFGLLTISNYPTSLLKVIERLKLKYKNLDIRFVYSGGPNQINPKVKPPPGSYVVGKQIPHDEMRYAISSCDVLTVNGWTASDHWAGDRDLLEAMTCGVPILSGDQNARVEMLGKDYPLFWHYSRKHHISTNSNQLSSASEQQIFDNLSELIDDKLFAKRIEEYLIKRSKLYSPDAISKHLRKEIRKINKDF